LCAPRTITRSQRSHQGPKGQGTPAKGHATLPKVTPRRQRSRYAAKGHATPPKVAPLGVTLPHIAPLGGGCALVPTDGALFHSSSSRPRECTPLGSLPCVIRMPARCRTLPCSPCDDRGDTGGRRSPVKRRALARRFTTKRHSIAGEIRAGPLWRAAAAWRHGRIASPEIAACGRVHRGVGGAVEGGGEVGEVGEGPVDAELVGGVLVR